MCHTTKAKLLPETPPAKTNHQELLTAEFVFANLSPNLSMIRASSNDEVTYVFNRVMHSTEQKE